jgi:hypothetical protein
MGLRGRLSNPSETHKTLLNEVAESHFKSLMDAVLCQDREPLRPPGRAADGRRRFGEVSEAVKTVLTQATEPMRIRDVHAAAEELLGGPVSFYSVADVLIKNSKGEAPLFERPTYGHYRSLFSEADSPTP